MLKNCSTESGAINCLDWQKDLLCFFFPWQCHLSAIWAFKATVLRKTPHLLFWQFELFVFVVVVVVCLFVVVVLGGDGVGGFSGQALTKMLHLFFWHFPLILYTSFRLSKPLCWHLVVRQLRLFFFVFVFLFVVVLFLFFVFVLLGGLLFLFF